MTPGVTLLSGLSVPNFNSLMPFIFELQAKTGQTDGVLVVSHSHQTALCLMSQFSFVALVSSASKIPET